MSLTANGAPPYPEGEIHVTLRNGTQEVLRLAWGSEYLWGYLDALSNRNLITVPEYRSASNLLGRFGHPEGWPRTEERH